LIQNTAEGNRPHPLIRCATLDLGFRIQENSDDSTEVGCFQSGKISWKLALAPGTPPIQAKERHLLSVFISKQGFLRKDSKTPLHSFIVIQIVPNKQVPYGFKVTFVSF
jgi:hypothetical protein